MKEILKMYMRFSIAIKILLNEGIFPFDIFNGFNFTFVFLNKKVTNNIINWLDTIFSQKNKYNANDFFISLYKNKKIPNLFFLLPNKKHSIWEIKKGEDENSFIIKEKNCIFNIVPKKIEFNNAFEEEINEIEEDFPQLSQNNLLKDFSKIDFLLSAKNFLKNEDIYNILLFINVLNILEKTKDKRISIRIYQPFIERFCNIMSNCVAKESKIVINNIFETILYNTITNENISLELKNSNILEVISQIQLFYILVDNSNVIQKGTKKFSKPIVVYSENNSPQMLLAITLDTVQEQKTKFELDTTFTFTSANINQLKKLCELTDIDSTFSYSIILPNNSNLIISAMEMKKFIEINEKSKNDNRILQEEFNKNLKFSKKKINPKVWILISFIFFTILIFSAVYFLNSGFIEKSIIGEKYGLTKYNGNAKELFYQPQEHVKVINSLAFENNKKLVKLEIGEGIEEIYSFAFKNSKIETLILPNSLIEIEDNAFSEMPNLKEIEIPTSVYSIGNCFNNCKSLKRIKIGLNLYKNNQEKFPSDISYTFLNDNETFNIDKYLEYAYENKVLALTNCKVPFPSEVSLKEEAKIIFNKAFYYSNATSINIPNIEMIFDNAFEGSKISKVKFGKNLYTIGCNAFKDCKNLKSIEIPDSVRELYLSAFENCENLEEVKLENGLDRIHSYAFYNCQNLKKIEIPSTVRFIDANAFGKCKNLEFVTIKGTDIKIQKDAFLGCDKVQIIYENEFGKRKNNYSNKDYRKEIEAIREKFNNKLNNNLNNIRDKSFNRKKKNRF